MAVFAKEKLASRVVLLESAEEDERLWLTMHTDKGPYLLCVWYRPPKPGDCKGIERFREELEQHEALGLGVLVVGDLNVHNLAWLKHSARNSPEGRALQDLCEEVGLQQLVREPTRGEYLLDLVLSDFEGVKCKVEPEVADHKLVAATLHLAVPEEETAQRKVWLFAKADWAALEEELAEETWERLEELDADKAEAHLTARLLEVMHKHVPTRMLKEKVHTPMADRQSLRAGEEKAGRHRNRQRKRSSRSVQQCSLGSLQGVGTKNKGRAGYFGKGFKKVVGKDKRTTEPERKVLTRTCFKDKRWRVGHRTRSQSTTASEHFFGKIRFK